jgi:hypothetical protein
VRGRNVGVGVCQQLTFLGGGRAWGKHARGDVGEFENCFLTSLVFSFDKFKGLIL